MIYNIDKLVKAKEALKIKVFDVVHEFDFIPAGIMIKYQDKLANAEKDPLVMYDVIAALLNIQDKTVTAEKLKNGMSTQAFAALSSLIFEKMTEEFAETIDEETLKAIKENEEEETIKKKIDQ